MKKVRVKKRGFTLVELLVAISIMGIITAISIPTINTLVKNKNKGIYEKYGETLINSAKLYADSYEVDLFGINPNGCQIVDIDKLKGKKLIKDVQIKNSSCENVETYVIVKKFSGRYQYQQQLVCKDTREFRNGKVLYEHKIVSPICTEESAAIGPKIKVDNPKEDWVTTEKAYVSVKIEDTDGLLQNNEVIYKWSKDEAGTQIVKEKRINFGNDLDDKSVTQKVPRPTDDGKYYLIIQPTNVVDVFGNYTTKPVVKGLYKFDSHKPDCNTAITLLSSSSPADKWVNKEIDFKFKFSTNELQIVRYKWITYKNGEKNEESDNESSVTSKKLKANGKRTYTIKVFDAAGNSKSCPADKDYYIDKEKPTCKITPDDEDKWYTENVELTLKPKDEVSAIAGKKLTTSTTPSYDGTTNKETQKSDSKGQKWYGYVIDEAGNTGVCSTSVKLDKSAPELTLKNSSEGEWTNKDVVINASVVEGGSGIKIIEYSHDKKDWYTKKWDSTSTTTNKTGTWTGERNNEFYVRAIDNAGNITTKKTAIKIDKTAPEFTEFSNSSNGEITNKDVVIKAAAKDEGGSSLDAIEYSHNDSKWLTDNWDKSSTKTKKTGTWSGERNNNFYVRAVDKAGNITKKKTAIRIDKTKPTLTLTNTSEGKWTNKDVVITATASDSGSDVIAIEYSHNDSKWLTDNWDKSSTKTKKTGTWTGKRNNTFYVRAIDAAGNISKETTAIKIDKVKPEFTLTNSSKGEWTNKKVVLTVEHSDDYSGFKKVEYSYDKKTWKDDWDKGATDAKTVGTWSAERNNTVYIRVADNAGNTEMKETKVKIDTTKPTLTMTNSSDGKWTNKNVVINASATDEASGVNKIQYSHNDSDWKTENWASTSTSTNKTGTWTGERDNTFYVRAVDNAGNISKKTTAIKIDKTVPSLKMIAYVRKKDNGNNGNKITSVTANGDDTVKTISPDRWFNSETDGVNLDVNASDSGGSNLESPVWKYNATQTTSFVDSPTFAVTESRTLSSGKDSVFLNSSGYRQASYIVEDNAGNKVTVKLKLKIDRQAPTLKVAAYVRDKDTFKNSTYVTTATANKDDSDVKLKPDRWFGVLTGGANFDITASDAISGMKTSTTWKYDEYGDTMFRDSPTLKNVYTRTLTKGKDSVYFNSGGYRHGTYIIEDNAGNTSRVKLRIKIDKTVPDTPSITNPTKGKCTTSNFKITATSNASVAGKAYWQYKFGKNGTVYKLDTTGKFELTIKTNRVKTMYIRSVDNALNASNWATTKITKKAQCLAKKCYYYGDKVDAVSYNNCHCGASSHSKGYPHFCVEDDGKICVRYNNGDLSKYPICKDRNPDFTYFCPNLDHEDIEDQYGADYIGDHT